MDEALAPSPPRGSLKVELLSPRAAALQAPVSAAGARRSLKEKVMQLNSESEQLSQAGKLDEADARLRQAHNLVAQADEDDLAKVELLAITLNNIGVLDRKQGNLDEAVKHLEMCASLENKVINFEKKPITQINLASTYLANKEYAASTRAAKAALELLFARFADGVNPNMHLRKDLLQFSTAWLLLARANAETFHAAGSGQSDLRTAQAHQILKEFRNAAHAAKDLLGEEDGATKAAAEAYMKAKESFAAHIPVAIKSLAGTADPAYPGDAVDVMSPRGHVKRADPKSQEGPGSPRVSSALRRKPSSGFLGTSDKGAMSPRSPRLPSIEATPGARSLSCESPREEASGTWSLKGSGTAAQPGRAGSARRRSSRLDPLALESPDDSSTRRSGSRQSSSRTGFAADGSSQRNGRLPALENGSNFAKKLERTNSCASDYSPLSARSSSSLKQPLPITHGSHEKMGLQALFGAAEANKLNYIVLRFIYLFQRENIAMFPTFRLTGASTLTAVTSGAVARLEAMEKELVDSNCESAAKRIREQREKIKKQKELESNARDLNLIVLDPTMTRRVHARAQRQRTLLQAAKMLLTSVTKTYHRMRFNEWKNHAKARKKYRPLRRACAQILKKLDSHTLRTRFLKWVKFVKICRQRVAAGLRPRDFEGRKQAIAMQELAELGRAEERRLAAERQEQIRRQIEEDKLAEEEARRIAEANRPVTPPPKISELIAEEIQTVYDAWYLAETAKGSKGTTEQLDAVKTSFRNSLTSFVTSDEGFADLERIEALSEDERLVEVDELTRIVSPFLISLVTGVRYNTQANKDLVQCLLVTTHELVDYHRIFFEDELFLSVIADHNIPFFTMMLSTIPNFDVSNEYLLELMTLCIKSEAHYLEYVELVLSRDKVCKFKGQKQALATHWCTFFDKCIPPSSKGFAAPGPSSPTVVNPVCRQRIISLLERLCLDHETFTFPHKTELRDKQTFLSRMCANGDLELVEVYTSLMDEDILNELLTRKQSDETTCLASAVKSQNVDLVRHLLSTHSCCGEKINQKIDGYSTVLDIAKAKGNLPGMIAVLRQYGSKDEDEDTNDNSARPGSTIGLDLDDIDGHKKYMDELDSNESSGYHMDDALDF
jgi:tetratricopeptide (TPR) repeat protein